MYTNKPGSWYLSLRGTPCAICGKPSVRLIVFAAERVITHEDDSWPPCQLANPSPSETPELRVQTHPSQAA